MAEKLLERTSLASSLLQSTNVFDPQNELQMSKEKAIDLFKSLLINIIQLNILSANRCDQALAEFKNCFDVEIDGIKLNSHLFSLKEHRLDEFFFKALGIVKYKELSYLVRIVLTLNHCQAAMECGFYHSNYILQPNMTPNTIISQSNYIIPHACSWARAAYYRNYETNDKFFRAARQRCDIHLEEEKKLKEKNDAEKRTQLIVAGFEKMKTKEKNLAKAIELMETEYFQCMELGEKKDDISFVIKRNGIKRKSEESKKEIEALEKQITELENKRKNSK